jgi:WD40 repeat protein
MTKSTFEPHNREERFNALIADYLDREAAGAAPPRAEWLREHAEFADELRLFLDEHERLGRLASPLRALAMPDAGGEAITVDGPARDTTTATTVHYFGDYELLNEIARGGMGIVYRARQKSLNRLVALKMILGGQLASTTEVERFHIEARAAANLDHPNIVAIHEVGQHEGQHYFSMKLIDGDNLAQAIAADRWPRRSLPGQRAIAQLVAQAARAVHYAHQRGILHRDLKPGNILLDSEGLPHVTDFGLAKRVGGEASLTQTGAIVGTPGYMAPEQTLGCKQLTTAADVYSLGAILYEMLTGQAPFPGTTPLDVLIQVRESEPAALRSHNSELQLDLQTICLKCLEKDPARRYNSAEALADDLERWLRGEPIQARTATTWERTVKWAKRRPALAALLGVSVLSAAALLIGGLVFNAQLQVALQTVNNQQQDLNKAQAAVAQEQGEAKQANDRARELLAEATSLRLAARSEVARPTDPGLALLVAIESAQLAPRRGADQNNALAAALTACREVGPLLRPGDRHDVRMVRYLAGGRRLLTISWDTVRIWDAKTGRKLVEFDGPKLRITSFALSPDEKRLALTFERYYECNVVEISGRQDRNGFVVTDQAVRVYDVESGAETHVLRGHRDRVVSASFDPQGKRIVTGSRDGTALIWDLKTGKQLQVLQGHECGVGQAQFTPDGRVLTMSSGTRRSKDNPLRQLLQRWPAERIDPPLPAPFQIRAGGSSAGDGNGLPQGEDLLACLWNAETRARITEIHTTRRGFQVFPFAGRLSQDGKYLLATAAGGAALWDVQTGKELHSFKVREETLGGSQLSGDGKRALTLHYFRTVRIWDLVAGKQLAALRGHTDDVTSAQFSPDPQGQYLLTTSKDKTARLWETATGKELIRLNGHELDVLAADFSPDGRRVATGSSDGTARFWNVTPRNEYGRLLDETAQTWWIAATPSTAYAQLGQRAVWSAAMSPDGRRVAAGYFDGTLRLFDVGSGKVLAETKGYAKLDPKLRDQLSREIFAVTYNDDSKRLLTVSADAVARLQDAEMNGLKEQGGRLPYMPVRIHDGATGEQRAALEGLTEGIRFALFSPDGARLLTVADDRINVVTVDRAGQAWGLGQGSGKDCTARIWDARTGKQLHVFAGNWNEIHSACWDPKGLRIATVHEDSTVRIWDVQTGRETQQITARIPPDYSSFTAAAFSPDGRRLLTWYDGRVRPRSSYGRPRQARVWDLTTGKLAFALKDSQGFAAYSPDGRWIVTTGYQPNSHTSSAPLGLHGRAQDLVFADRTAKLWDAETGALHIVLKGHERSVHSAAFSKDSRWLVTASEDRTARVWDIASGREFITLRGHDDDVKTAVFSPDAKTVLTVSWDGTARLWPVDPLPQALERRPRDLTDEERERFEVRKAP